MMRTLFFTVASALLLLVVVVAETSDLLGDATVACAEEVRASKSGPVRNSPGETSDVITRVRSGTQMTVLSQSGRWLKVRVNGRTGWVTRTSVFASDAKAPKRKKRRRPFVEGRSLDRKKRIGSAPDDRIGGDAIEDEDDLEDFSDDDDFGDGEDFSDDDDFGDGDDFDDDFGDDDDFEEEEAIAPEQELVKVNKKTAKLLRQPKSKSKSVAKAKRGDDLVVIERDGKWIKVENDEGETGWVRTKDVKEDPRNFEYRYKEYTARYFGSLGGENISQSFSTNKDCGLCNYKISTNAIVVALGGDVIYDYDDQFLLAGDAAYRYSRASPGIGFIDPADGMASNIAVQMHRVDLGVRGGYKFKYRKESGIAAYARLGYHYDRFGVNDVENFAVNLPRLPSEILSGFTVGVMLDVPQYSPKVAFQLGLDRLVGGTRVQTLGLEDGSVSSPSAIWGRARLDYKFKPTFKISGQYNYTGTTTEWTGMAAQSLREHPAAAGDPGAKRSDVSHALFVGISKALDL